MLNGITTMKKILLAFATCLLAAASHADTITELEMRMQQQGALTQELQARCTREGILFQNIAGYRDSNVEPQRTYDTLIGFARQSYVPDPEAFLKKAINAVYFDERFTGAGGQALADQITYMCLDPHGKYSPHFQPLQ
jgi:adenine-specific DNA methylase